MKKRRIEFSYSEWMGLTPEQRDRWLQHLRMQNFELGLIDDKFYESRDDFQRDHDWYMEEMSLGGRPYKEPRR